QAAAERFPGEYQLVSAGVDVELFAPREKRRSIVVEWQPVERALTRAAIRMLAELPEWEVVLLREKPLSGRPYVPRALQRRVHVRTARDAPARASLLGRASVFVPALAGEARLRLEAEASGCAVAAPAGVREQPERAEAESYGVVATTLDGVYSRLGRRRRPVERDGARGGILSDRAWIDADLHLHTAASHDCAIPVADLLDHAEGEGLGAIAITDHNVFAGALEAVELARGRRLTEIPGEEIKTDGQGEVIGLFLTSEIPRGMSFADTIAAIRAQGGLVYLPHPFDRRHAIPDPATLHRHLADIDVFEVYNARLLREPYNDEALRFARKYNLTMGAGSDAHVLPGVGTGVVRMRSFRTPEEFLISLRSAEILRRPRSLAYLQTLKWAAQVKEMVR